MSSRHTENREQIYQEEGLIYPVRVLEPDQAARLRSRCDELEAALGGRPRTIEVRQMHMHFSWAYELTTCPAILDEVEQILGPDIVIWASELFSKHPQDQNVSVGWHRDQGYMGFAVEDVVTSWVALSDSVQGNGCMRAIPGPNRLSGTDLSPEVTSPHHIPEEFIDESQVIDVELQAGEMSLHDCRIVHGSGPNLSDRKRVGFAIRYVRADSLPLHGRPPVVLARGSIQGDNFELVAPPTESRIDLAGMKQSAIKHLDTILINLQQFNA